MEIIRVEVILGGSCPDRNFPGWELSGCELSWVGIFFGESVWGGNCAVGIIRGAIFRVEVFMLPMCVGANNNFHVKQNE